MVMTERFDAEKWLRDIVENNGYSFVQYWTKEFIQIADELAALKEANRQWKEQDDLRKQGWATTTFEASLIQNDALRERIMHLEDSIQPMVQMIADQGARIAELQAKVDWFEDKDGSIVGFPWDAPYNDGYETAKDEYREKIIATETHYENKLEAEQAISRKLYEALKSYSTSFNPLAREAIAEYEGRK